MSTTLRDTTIKIAALLSLLVLAAGIAATEQVVDVGVAYVDPGAVAQDNYEGDVSARIVTVNQVNTAALGTYTVTYSVTDSSGNAAVPAVRTVRVADRQKPVITLLGSPTVTIPQQSTYTDAGATARDNYDGDLTSKINTFNAVNTAAPGTYAVTYTVSDSSGNPAALGIRTVTVTSIADTQKPVITLVGDSYIKVKVGRTYVDAGATAYDNLDGNITSKIVVANNVNPWWPGTYTVVYNVKDAAGNAAAAVTRTVRVTFFTKNDGDGAELLIASPMNGSTYSVSGPAILTLTASAPVNADSVEYAIDGNVVGSSDQAPFAVSVDIDPAAMGWGEHHVSATARLTTGTDAPTDEAIFTLAPASAEDDVNHNGIPDNPFAALALEGDTWVRSVDVAETGAKRTTAVVRFEGVDENEAADTPVVVMVSNGGETAPAVSVLIPRSLLPVDETGIAIVQLADDLATLFGSDQAALLGPEPKGTTPVAGGRYVEINVLTSKDGGVTFDEIDEARLASYPVHVEMDGVAQDSAVQLALYKHPMFVDSDPATGVMVVAHEGAWSASGIHNAVVDSGVASADLSSLSVIGLYQKLDGNDTDTPAGCVGGSLGGSFPSSNTGDLALIGLAVATLLVVSRKQARHAEAAVKSRS